MPKAEVGSVKYLNNKLRSRGLGRLRWYCQVCEKQCPDAHGFSMHTKSESHVRRMLVVGEDPRKAINDFSTQFRRDFLTLLRTGHGEKMVHVNRFYQEYIADKEHVHMNSTKWQSLSEFAKMLGREGVCLVEENDKGLHISWIDDSPEALRRRDALKKKEAMDQGDEQLEQRMIQEQIRRAKAASGKEEEEEEEEHKLTREEGQKITLSFGAKPAEAPQPDAAAEGDPEEKPKISMKMGSSKPATKNVFKKNALASGPKKQGFVPPKKVSEAERIMKEEMDRKRSRGSVGFGMPPGKKQRQ